jgi:hypothetical protein
MSGVEAALVNVGRAVVTPLFIRWLAERRACAAPNSSHVL